MNIALLGSGGREHALAWKLHHSPSVEKIIAIPGNPGIASYATCYEVTPLPHQDYAEALVQLLKEQHIELVIIGPEAPLVEGIGDRVSEMGFYLFGPSSDAAQLEGSKTFAKRLMKKYGIPTGAYEVFSDAEKACAYIRSQSLPIVIKSDGLAAGKGVVVAQTMEEAEQAIHYFLEEASFKTGTILIEEFLEGEEASLLAFVDGEHVVPMISAQDHKRLLDGDEGPNTGGMGAYAPAPVMTENLCQETYEKILLPTVQAMKKEGKPFVGCLYAGLMITKDGPKVVEFNVRFGDPETEVILPLLDSDLGEICMACARGELKENLVKWKEGAAICVVLASKNYPYGSSPEESILGDLAPTEDSFVFQCGTKVEGENASPLLLASGGRVLTVTATGENLAEAKKKVDVRIGTLHFEGMQYRRDIAHRALKK